jgi:glycosyltransferase involved in cell wall biosynthesis
MEDRSDKRSLRILILSVWWPFPPDNGSRLRAYHLIKELARQGHRIRLVAGIQTDIQEAVADGIPKELTDLCVEIKAVPWIWYEKGKFGPVGALRALFSDTPRSVLETPNPLLRDTIAEQLRQPTDAIIAMEIGMDAHLPAIPTRIPTILDQVELSGMERTYREANNIEGRLRTGMTYWKGVRYWRKRLSRYPILTTVSELEAEAVRGVVGPGPKIRVIPNGVDIGSFPAEPPLRRNTGQLLYNGALTYLPNYEAVHWFAEAILPKIRETVPAARLVVTGRYTPKAAGTLLQNPDIQLTGFLPELQSTLAMSMAAVVPLRAGGGTRLKILEAFAAHLPVVATTIGAAGLGVESGKHLLLADTAEEFARATIQVLTNENIAERLAANARHLAEQQFDWRAIGGTLANVIEEAIVQAKK